MKKTLITLLIFATLATSFPSNSNAKQLTFEQRQASLLSRIDNVLGKLDNAQNNIAGNTKVDDATKQSILNALNNVEAALLSYKSEVEQASTLDELQALNQEVLQYLLDNKDVIKKNIGSAITNIANQAIQKAEEFKEAFEKLLPVLKAVCPSEADTITELEAQLAQLESEIATLASLIQTKDAAAIKQELATMSQLMKSMVANVTQIQSTCATI